MGRIQSFEDLEVWKAARTIRRRVYEIARSLPDFERYNLAHQMRAAGVSLTANIAEGYGRYHYKENIQFCRHSRGSAYEIIDHLITCHDEKYLGDDDYQDIRRDLDTFLKMLNGYIGSIGKTGGSHVS